MSRDATVVAFGLIEPGGGVIEEDALAAWMAATPDAVRPNGEQDGMLRISVPGAPAVQLFDWIGPLVQFMCLGLPNDLLQGGSAEVSLYTVDEEYEATFEGEDVVLSGRRVPNLRASRTVLLPALVACADRYVEMMRPAAEAQGWSSALDGTAALAAEVRARLEGREPAPRPPRPEPPDDEAG